MEEGEDLAFAGGGEALAGELGDAAQSIWLVLATAKSFSAPTTTLVMTVGFKMRDSFV